MQSVSEQENKCDDECDVSVEYRFKSEGKESCS